MNVLDKFINKCLEQYDLFINKKDDLKQYIYEYKNCEKSDNNIELYFDKFLMEHNKDLEINIFFEDKNKLINYIKPFIYNPLEKYNIGEERYKRAGFTFKAGLLFYGSPGCGKTSTIKAILKYTNRHGIIINLSKIKTCQELETIFRKRTFCGKNLEGKQICFILEDCDAFEDNIIHSRKKDEEDKKIFEQNNNGGNDIIQFVKLMESSGTTNVKFSSNNDNVNLSCFLNILDGIIELHGIMIIMTTNHPEKIDEALIRPGRFDFKYEFKRASRKIIKDMIQFKFELSQSQIDKYCENMNIKDDVLSPAEIQSICFKNDNVIDCINDIILSAQK
jgi:SpoVK/Ycf46/Vps4 family AAA+-type ATPase